MRRFGPLLALCALAGCGGGGGHTTTVVRSSKVEVVAPTADKAAAGSGGFDVARLYQRESPGVVTVISLAGGASGLGCVPSILSNIVTGSRCRSKEKRALTRSRG